jgi:hypothetical protein
MAATAQALHHHGDVGMHSVAVGCRLVDPTVYNEKDIGRIDPLVQILTNSPV